MVSGAETVFVPSDAVTVYVEVTAGGGTIVEGTATGVPERIPVDGSMLRPVEPREGLTL
jgi:hypothetical protein